MLIYNELVEQRKKSENKRKIEILTVNQMVVGSSPTGGANENQRVTPV